MFIAFGKLTIVLRTSGKNFHNRFDENVHM